MMQEYDDDFFFEEDKMYVFICFSFSIKLFIFMGKEFFFVDRRLCMVWLRVFLN